MLKKYIMDSPIGALAIVADETHLKEVHMENQIHEADHIETGLNAVILETQAFFEAYFKGENPSFNRELIDWEGTEFQTQIWELLLDIPYGQTRTYKELAQAVAKRRNLKQMSAQAVGGAVGSNPISVIVPCHRVVGSNNHLTGFGGGLDRKIKLLQHEGNQIKEMKLIKKV